MAYVSRRSKPNAWIYIRSFLQWCIGIPVLGIDLTIVLLASLFVSPYRLDPLLRIFAAHMVWLTGIQLRTHGLEHLESDRIYIFLFNHINVFDHFVIYHVLKRCIRGVEKEDHFRWPLYGLFLKRVGQVSIPPRGNTARALRSLEQAKAIFEQGICLGIAPEGTRTTTGELGPFKKGAFHLAIDTQATIVPVVLKGMYDFNRKGDWLLYPGPVDVYIEKPISTKGMTTENVSVLTKQVRKIFLDRLIQKASI